MPVITPANTVIADSPALTSPRDNSLETSDASLSAATASSLGPRDIRRQIQEAAQATILAKNTTAGAVTDSLFSETMRQKNEQSDPGISRSRGVEWEAKNSFASPLAGIDGISGLNAGHVPSLQKPEDMHGLVAAEVTTRYDAVAHFNSIGSLLTTSRVYSEVGGLARFGSPQLLQPSARMISDDSLGVNGKYVPEAASEFVVSDVARTEGAAVVQIEQEGVSQGQYAENSETSVATAGVAVSHLEKYSEVGPSSEALVTGPQRPDRPLIGKVRKVLQGILGVNRD